MLISEELFIISLDVIKGKLTKGFRQDQHLLLAGALVMDLIIQGRISIIDDVVHVINSQFIESEIINEALSLILNSPMKLTTLRCVRYFSSYHISMRNKLILGLESQGVLIHQGKLPKYFGSLKIKMKRMDLRFKILKDLEKILIQNIEPDRRMWFLISLLYVNKMHVKLLPKEFKKLVEIRVKELSSGELITKAVKTAIRERGL